MNEVGSLELEYFTSPHFKMESTHEVILIMDRSKVYGRDSEREIFNGHPNLSSNECSRVLSASWGPEIENLLSRICYHDFTGVEKDFICQEAKKSANDELLIDPFLFRPTYPKTFTGMILERYRINSNKLKCWQKSIRLGLHNRDGDKIGRPELCSH